MEALGCFKGGGEGVEGLADGWTDAVRSTCCAWGSYGSVPLGRLDAIFANTGAGGGGNDDVEALGCFKGGGKDVEGLADGWTEAVRSTCCA